MSDRDRDALIDVICNVAGGLLGTVGETVDTSDTYEVKQDAANVQRGIALLTGALCKVLVAADGQVKIEATLGSLMEDGVDLLTARAQALGIDVIHHEAGPPSGRLS